MLNEKVPVATCVSSNQYLRLLFATQPLWYAVWAWLCPTDGGCGTCPYLAWVIECYRRASKGNVL